MILVLLCSDEVRLTTCGLAGDGVMEHRCGRDHIAGQDVRDSQVGFAIFKQLTSVRVTSLHHKASMHPF